MLLEEPILLPVLAAVRSGSVLQVACTCRCAESMLARAGGLWQRQICHEYDALAADAAEWAGKHGGGRAAHRHLADVRKAFDAAVEVVLGDLAQFPNTHRVGAIICPAEPSCMAYGYCALAVHQAAGPMLRQYIERTALPPLGGQVEVGCSIATPSFRMSSIRAIVHAVGPTCMGSHEEQLRLLKGAYASAIDVLEEWPEGPIRTAACAAVSTGGNGISQEASAAMAMSAFKDAFLQGRLEKMYMVLYDEYTRQRFQTAKDDVVRRLLGPHAPADSIPPSDACILGPID